MGRSYDDIFSRLLISLHSSRRSVRRQAQKIQPYFTQCERIMSRQRDTPANRAFLLATLNGLGSDMPLCKKNVHTCMRKYFLSLIFLSFFFVHRR